MALSIIEENIASIKNNTFQILNSDLIETGSEQMFKVKFVK